MPTKEDSQKESATPQLVHSAWGEEAEQRGGEGRGGRRHLELEYADCEPDRGAGGGEGGHASRADVGHATGINYGLELHVFGC